MMEKIIIVLIILIGIYIGVLALIFTDLWSGVRKAKKRGEYISSQGFKRTIDKISKYYNAMFALTVLDAMQIGAIWYFDSYWGYSIPIFPIVSLLGALGVGLIEIKSIYEKADKKEKKQYTEIAELLMKCAKNHDLKDITNALNSYFNENEQGS